MWFGRFQTQVNTKHLVQVSITELTLHDVIRKSFNQSGPKYFDQQFWSQSQSKSYRSKCESFLKCSLQIKNTEKDVLSIIIEIKV